MIIPRLTSTKELSGDGTLSVPLMLLSDDYVLPAEPIIDYVTRFSGLTSDDLNPTISTHAIISHRAAIMKLRCVIWTMCALSVQN